MSDPAERAVFATTRWSVVRASTAGASSDAPARRAALETLCRTYWKPLYAFARRRGLRAEEAEDCVQGLFARLLERNDIAEVDARRGRFRAWLQAAFANHLENRRTRERAQKRGGGRAPLNLDALDAAEIEPRADDSPAQAFERAWALAVLAAACARLRAEQARIGRERVHDALLPALVDDAAARPYRELAAELALSENAVKVAVHRLRRRLGELVRDEVLQTLDDSSELEDELRALHSALGTAPRESA